MRERWHENILTLRLVDDRGEVRGIKWPSVRALKRAGIRRPYRFLAQVGMWPNAVMLIAVYGGSFVLFLVIERVLFSAFGFGLVLEPSPGTFNSTVAMVSQVLWYLLTTVAAIKVYNVRSAPKYVRTMLKHGKCPWCLYDLSGSVAASDGRTTCPECGGVWKMAGGPVSGC
jgi:hypothetical protein